MNSANNAGAVLVVDDDQINRQAVGRTIVQAGYVVILAASGEVAMDHLELDEIALVVTDVRMPGMTGIELLRDVRTKFPRVPVILMTSSLEEDICEGARTWGATAVFQKPIRRNELITAINVAVEDALLRATFAVEPEFSFQQAGCGMILEGLSGKHEQATGSPI